MNKFWKISRILNAIAWIGCGIVAGVYFCLGHPIDGIEFIVLSIINGFIYILNPYEELIEI